MPASSACMINWSWVESVVANYSLTTYSPYEGWQVAFNGMSGRIETWEDIPYLQKLPEDQSKKHAVEMSNADDAMPGEVREILVMDNFTGKHEVFTTPKIKGGHGFFGYHIYAGFKRLYDKLVVGGVGGGYNYIIWLRVFQHFIKAGKQGTVDAQHFFYITQSARIVITKPDKFSMVAKVLQQAAGPKAAAAVTGAHKGQFYFFGLVNS